MDFGFWHLKCAFLRTTPKYYIFLWQNNLFPVPNQNLNEKRSLFLQKLRSPLTKKDNKKARFLLYLDLQNLKKKSLFAFNNTRKKIFSSN